MKVFFSIVVLSIALQLNAQVFFTESFETAGNYTLGMAGDCSCVSTNIDGIDGQNDYFTRVTDGDITANFIDDYTGELDGSGNESEGIAHYWAAEDINDNGVGGSGNQIGCLELSVDISGRSNIEFSGWFAGHGASSPTPYLPENDLEVFYSIDSGPNVKILDWHESEDETNISLDEDGDGFGDGMFPLQSQFQKVTYPIPDVGNSILVTICMDSNTSNKEFAVDYIELSETTSLPVVWKDFSARQVENTPNVLIDWITHSEVDNDFFIIQRSFDGYEFTDLERIEGQGNETIQTKYSYLDKEFHTSKMVYYRLIQVDYDHTKAFSPVIPLKLRTTELSVELYPNPAHEYLQLKFSSPFNQPLHVEIYNSAGTLVLKSHIPKGKVVHELDLQNLPSGPYWFSTFAKAKSEIKSFVIGRL